jgi:lauroyl/myristoyl acyltransferase
VPAFVLRQPDTRYQAAAYAPVEQAEGELRDTLPQNVQRIADLFESIIQQYPEQWFNYVPVFSAP